jgi:hypothetical protein
MCSDISVRCEQINIEDVVNTLTHSWRDARTCIILVCGSILLFYIILHTGLPSISTLRGEPRENIFLARSTSPHTVATAPEKQDELSCKS